MALANSSSKRLSISQEREVLKARSFSLKIERTRNEAFDEEESRQNHDKDLEDSINDHYQNLKTESLKRKIESGVRTILYFFIWY